MHDFLDRLAESAKVSINMGYYENIACTSAVSVSLKQTIIQSNVAAVIAEIKGASPSKGTIKKTLAPDEVAKAMAKGGAIGISVLAEPKFFCGSLRHLAKVREAVNLPILMKDIIVSPLQLDAAVQVGANAVLLIQALFDRNHCECKAADMIDEAHSRNLEVLLEAHTTVEFNRAVESAADLVGVNNRDLRTLAVDLNVTRDILDGEAANGRIIVSESGINSAADVLFLRGCGAKAFLVGSAIMLADDIEAKVKELVQADGKITNHQRVD